MEFVYLDPNRNQGFCIVHILEPQDSYLIYTRQKNPDESNEAIKQVVEALGLNIEDFSEKPKDSGISTCIFIGFYIHTIPHNNEVFKYQ
jgi:hypothetical protein